jgi:hypothetical protein
VSLIDIAQTYYVLAFDVAITDRFEQRWYTQSELLKEALLFVSECHGN